MRCMPKEMVAECEQHEGRNTPVYRMVHDDVIKWKLFPRTWPFARGIHRSPVSSPHKGQWRGALMVSLICAWINVWVNNREAGDLRRHRAQYDVTVIQNRHASVYSTGASSAMTLLYSAMPFGIIKWGFIYAFVTWWWTMRPASFSCYNMSECIRLSINQCPQ